jgi:putative Holliday junction resolvase
MITGENIKSSAGRRTARILGIDYGTARTGLAVSDELGLMAHGIETVRTMGFRHLIEIISAKIKEYGITLIVMGNPINMNGSIGEKSVMIREFAERLESETGVRVILFDERRSTIAAYAILNETNTRGKKRKSVIDTLSAEIILQNYIDATRNQA